MDAEEIVHPPHIISEDGSFSTSSFIPFCSVAGKIKGSKVENLGFPACDLFKPVIRKGQRCYQADLNSPLKKPTIPQLFMNSTLFVNRVDISGQHLVPLGRR